MVFGKTIKQHRKSFEITTTKHFPLPVMNISLAFNDTFTQQPLQSMTVSIIQVSNDSWKYLRLLLPDKKRPKKVLPFWWWNHGKHQQRHICKQPRMKAKAWRQTAGSNKHNTWVCLRTLPLNHINEPSFTRWHTSSLAFMFHVIMTMTDGSDLIQHSLHLRQRRNIKGKLLSCD